MNTDFPEGSGKVTVQALLDEAREVVGRGWAKESYARTEAGRPCAHDDPEAVKFCMLGGLRKAYLNLTGENPPDTPPEVRSYSQFHPAYQKANALVAAVLLVIKPTTYGSFVAYNDRYAGSGKNVQDVFVVARKMADKCIDPKDLEAVRRLRFAGQEAPC